MVTPARALRRGTVVRYAVGSVGTGGFGTLPGLVLLYYMTTTLGIDGAFAGAAIGVAKIWDVIIDPWIGARSDRSLARTGSRRRFMVIGAVTMPIFFVLTFAVPAGLSPELSAVWVLAAFLLAATAFSLFQVPYIALPAELVDSYDARTKLLSARVIVLSIAILAFGGGAPELVSLGVDTYQGHLIMAAAAAVIFLVAFLVASTVERSAAVGRTPTAPASEPIQGLEPPKTDMFSNFRRGWLAVRDSQPYRALLSTFVLQALAIGLMLAGIIFVTGQILSTGTTFVFLALIAPAIAVTPVWSIIARHIGKERAFRIATVIFALAASSLVLLVWFPGEWIYGPVAIAGAAYAGLQSLPLAMLPDTVAHDAEKNGPGRAGTFSGVWTAGETAGLALGAPLLGFLLSLTGFIPTEGGAIVEQPESAIIGIIVSFSVIPAALMFASLISLARYPLRKADIDRLVRHADAPPPPTGAPAA